MIIPIAFVSILAVTFGIMALFMTSSKSQRIVDRRILAILLSGRHAGSVGAEEQQQMLLKIDPVTRWGWSVQVQGRSVIPRRLGVDTACGRPTAGQVVQMEPGIISGHRTHLCPFIDALLTTRQALPTL